MAKEVRPDRSSRSKAAKASSHSGGAKRVGGGPPSEVPNPNLSVHPLIENQKRCEEQWAGVPKPLVIFVGRLGEAVALGDVPPRQNDYVRLYFYLNFRVFLDVPKTGIVGTSPMVVSDPNSATKVYVRADAKVLGPFHAGATRGRAVGTSEPGPEPATLAASASDEDTSDEGVPAGSVAALLADFGGGSDEGGRGGGSGSDEGGRGGGSGSDEGGRGVWVLTFGGSGSDEGGR
jgi:hypothetical protein